LDSTDKTYHDVVVEVVIALLTRIAGYPTNRIRHGANRLVTCEATTPARTQYHNTNTIEYYGNTKAGINMIKLLYFLKVQLMFSVFVHGPA
jgi:hypothetical protein